MINMHTKHAAKAQTFADKRSWKDFRIGLDLSAKSYNEHANGARQTAGVLGPPGALSVKQTRMCLGVFEAAEALGLGFVHGVTPYLYVERLSEGVLKELCLSGNVEDEKADLYVRIPASRESAFRGIVQKDGVPVSDILQVWLDVGQHPARGEEQADLIWRRILSPAFESSGP